MGVACGSRDLDETKSHWWCCHVKQALTFLARFRLQEPWAQELSLYTEDRGGMREDPARSVLLPKTLRHFNTSPL